MKYNFTSKNEDKKQKNYKIKQYMIKKINAIKNFIFPIYKNVRDNKKELIFIFMNMNLQLKLMN